MSDELEASDLASLNVEAIEGIGVQAAERLDSVNISTIDDLDTSDPRSLYEDAKISLYKLMEYRRKAQMILSVSTALKADEASLKILGENGYSITKTIEEELPVLEGLTNQPRNRLIHLQDNLLLLLIGLEDHIARKKGSIGLLRKTRPRSPTDSDPIPDPDPGTDPIPDYDPGSIVKPTTRTDTPAQAMVKTALSGGVGGLVGGGLGAAGYLNTLVSAGLGAIVGIGTWVALYYLMKD